MPLVENFIYHYYRGLLAPSRRRMGVVAADAVVVSIPLAAFLQPQLPVVKTGCLRCPSCFSRALAWVSTRRTRLEGENFPITFKKQRRSWSFQALSRWQSDGPPAYP